MTDIFLSYAGEDRERVRPIRDALAAEGFDVFWDREAPPDRERHEWIGQQLDAAHCAMVFWSRHSAASDDIVREALAAKSSGKLIPILLEPLESGHLPMGLYTAQASVIPQEGLTPEVWQHLRAEVETLVIRPWMHRKLAALERHVSALTATQERLVDREMSLQRRIDGLERQVDAGHAQKGQIEAALAAEKPLTGKREEQAAASRAQEEAVLQLYDETPGEGRNVKQLRTEMAYLENRAAGGATASKTPEAEKAPPYDYTYYRDWYLLIATMALLISAVNNSVAAMVISSVLLLGGVLWGFILR